MEGRQDDRYISLRVTEEERKDFDEKLRRTGLTGKAFLRKCIDGEKLRECTPPEASNVHHQLSKIDTNLRTLSLCNNLNPKLIQLYSARYKQFHKIVTDITTMLYLAQLSVEESC